MTKEENNVTNNTGLSETECEQSPDVSKENEPLVDAIENVPIEGEEEILVSQRKQQQRKPSRRKRRKQAKIVRILTMTEDTDIRYRGFLSYRALRIIAWVFFLLSQIGVLLSIGAKFDVGFAETVGVWSSILPVFQNFMTPMFLVAAFATILNNSRKFSSLIAVYAFMAAVFYAAFLLLHDRYMVGLVMKIGEMNREDAGKALDMMFSLAIKNGFLSFNIFIDLLLCTLFTFFIIYRPKKIFVGKRLIVFRLFALLPVAYEIGSIVVKALTSMGTMIMPSYVYPLLTTKPPMTFLIFVFLTFFIKKREQLYRRNGRTHEEYQAFLGTNLNSLQFSTYLVTQFIAVAFLDLLMLIVLGLALQGKFGGGTEGYTAALDAVQTWGFGDCLSLLFVTPILMLFSYTRTHKNTQLDLIINLVGIILLIIIYLEGLYQGLVYGVDFIKDIIGKVMAG